MKATPVRRGNGRTPEENRLFARIAADSRPPQVKAETAAKMREARRRNIADRIDPERTMDPADLDAAVRLEMRLQLDRARAKSLTARRKARVAREREAQAAAELAAAISAAQAEIA